MKSELIMAVNQLCAEKDLPREVILSAIEEALVHAYRRNYASNAPDVTAKIDPETGDVRITCERRIVEGVLDPSAEMDLAEARKINAHVEVGETITIERAPGDFGRIAAQTAKQVILQRIHEAERDALYEFFHQREGELITGTVQSIDYRTNQVNIALGKKVEGILAIEDQLPGERYRNNQNVRCLMAEVHKGTRGPQIRLSRTHRNMLRRLLEREIPEIYSGAVEIRAVAREPAQRSKVAVSATQPGVDPVGSCVGMRGMRIQNIVDELGGEKIDVVEWNSDMRLFIANALSPAHPTDTVLIEDGDVRTAIVVVPDRSLSVAIGKEGQNARLAAKLTGWRIDIKSETEVGTEGLAELKRQQIQAIRQRSQEAKTVVATTPPPPGDDLLSRAEWLLREKDKSAVTLEQAARLLAEAEGLTVAPAAEAPVAAAETPDAGAETIEAIPAEGADTAPEAAISETPSEGLVTEEQSFEEDESGDAKTAKKGKSKKASKKTRLVFDETLGEVVTQRLRKPGREGWGEDL